jgi:hypothetical protein
MVELNQLAHCVHNTSTKKHKLHQKINIGRGARVVTIAPVVDGSKTLGPYFISLEQSNTQEEQDGWEFYFFFLSRVRARAGRSRSYLTRFRSRKREKYESDCVAACLQNSR